jgi:viroplasmin and RNaseH domain-containing protein
MNSTYKMLLVMAIGLSLASLEAAQNTVAINKSHTELPKNKQQQLSKGQETISMEQIQQMQEMEQFMNAIAVMLTIKFFIRYPKFISSLTIAYSKDSSTVEQKVVAQTQTFVNEHGDQELNTILKEIKAGPEVQEMVQQIKPFIANILAHEVIKWVHIASMSNVKI